MVPPGNEGSPRTLKMHKDVHVPTSWLLVRFMEAVSPSVIYGRLSQKYLRKCNNSPEKDSSSRTDAASIDSTAATLFARKTDATCHRQNLDSDQFQSENSVATPSPPPSRRQGHHNLPRTGAFQVCATYPGNKKSSVAIQRGSATNNRCVFVIPTHDLQSLTLKVTLTLPPPRRDVKRL